MDRTLEAVPERASKPSSSAAIGSSSISPGAAGAVVRGLEDGEEVSATQSASVTPRAEPIAVALPHTS